LVLISDNDKAWDEMQYRLKQQIENVWTVDLSDLGKYKDINEFVLDKNFDYQDFLSYCKSQYQTMLDMKVKEVENEKLEQFEKVKNINKIHQSWMPIEFPVDTLNQEIWKIKPDDFSILIGSPNAWKTTFAYIMMLHNMKLWHKVWFLSYEMDFWDILNQYYLWKIPWGMDRFDESLLTDEDNKILTKYK
jgi:hypothetical protein